jgi:ribonuclease PH
LRICIDLTKLGERTLTLDCDVIQADGGTRTAAVTGGYVAAALALRKLIAAGTVPADTLVTSVAAVSVGIVNGEPRLDLCYAEDSQADADCNVVMTAQGRFVEIQGTAEREPFDRASFDALLALAERGIRELLAAQQAVF